MPGTIPGRGRWRRRWIWWAWLNWGYLAILAAWGMAGLIIAVRRFSWLPRGG